MGLNAHEFNARFWALIGATFLGFLGIGTVLPALAPHVRHDLGGTDFTVGLVIGTFSFFALGSRLFAGPLADRRGRKTAFLTGLISCAAAGGAYLLPIGIGGAFVARALQGFGEACLYTGAASWAVEIAGLHRSSQALGYISTGIWGGISAGPVVGHWLGSFENAAAMQLIAALAGAALLWRIPEEYSPEPHDPARAWLPRRLILPGLALGFVNVQYPVVAGFLILHLANYGNSGRAAFTAFAGSILLSRFFLGGLPDRIRPSITFYIGTACMGIALLSIAAGPPGGMAIAATALLGFGFSFPWASIASKVLKETPNGERGSAVSLLGAFCDLFVGAGSFAAGAIAKNFGYPAAFLMAASAICIAAIVGRSVFRGDETASAEVREFAAAANQETP
ncbi:MAG: MFS transporter [Candidatus Solibacter usitatus]|nr:MFS transporter [Candidatus Solibacter usitatus]